MANSNRNAKSIKGNEQESRKGSLPENRGNKKLPDRAHENDTLSTTGNTSNPKYSRTKVRKEEKERRDNSDKSRR